MRRCAVAALAIAAAGLAAFNLRAEPLELDYSTYVGGSGDDAAYALDVDSSGAAYICGVTRSIDYPVVNPYQSSFGGGYFYYTDGFVSKLAPGGSSLLYSTYLGGNGDDFSLGIDVSGGDAYVCGRTTSTNFPLVNPYQSSLNYSGVLTYDLFVSHLSSSGSALVSSTYLGGLGNELDGAFRSGIAVDAGGIYVCGFTSALNFPVVNPYQSTQNGAIETEDSFLSKLTLDGAGLIFSTYFGGNYNDRATSIQVVDGEAYVAGHTFSTTFPVVNPYQATHAGTNNFDAFAAKFSSSGSSLTYSTYLGGTAEEVCQSLSVANGEAFLCGRTESVNFPVVAAFQTSNAGYQDVFISRISSSGSSLLYSTYLGGSLNDRGYGIALLDGDMFVTGQTYSSDFRTVNPYQSSREASDNFDAFLTRIVSGGSALLYSTYLGGSLDDLGNGVATGGNAVYLAGETSSFDFPIANAYQSTNLGGVTPFVAKLSFGEAPIIDSGDYDGDGTCDAALFRSSLGYWAIRDITRVYLGAAGDIPASGDFNNDGTTEIAIYRPSLGMWSIRGVTRLYFGGASDIPAPGDYNGDGRCDAAVFKPSSGLWAVRNLTRVYFGQNGDIPVPYYKQGSRAKNIAIWRPSNGKWAVHGLGETYFGSNGDLPAPADFTGDGSEDAALFRASNGLWTVSGVTRLYFGAAGDSPVPADYDGNRAAEFAVFRPSNGNWLVRDLTRFTFGQTGDVPAAARPCWAVTPTPKPTSTPLRTPTPMPSPTPRLTTPSPTPPPPTPSPTLPPTPPPTLPPPTPSPPPTPPPTPPTPPPPSPTPTVYPI